MFVRPIIRQDRIGTQPSKISQVVDFEVMKTNREDGCTPRECGHSNPARQQTPMSKSKIPKDVRKESPAMQARIAGGLWWVCILAGVVGFDVGTGSLIRYPSNTLHHADLVHCGRIFES